MKSKEGFTLIELLVVMAVLATLVTILLVAINPFKLISDARDQKKRSDLNQVRVALQNYYNDCKTYPATAIFDDASTGLLHLSTPGAMGATTGDGVDGTAGTCDDGKQYMKQVPTDADFHYTLVDSQNYRITADLVNRSTEDTNSMSKCDATASDTVDFAVCND